MARFLTGKLVLACLLLSFVAQAQQLVLTRKSSINIHPECQGYLEYLPSDYATSGKKYPLLIVCHGTGECGSGSASDLGRLVNLGPMGLISSGRFPTSFTVNGVTSQFIIIAPQFTTYNAGSSEHIEAVFKYVTDRYRVDPARLYVSGLSMGGKYTWNIASSATGPKLAAVVPICGSSESWWWIANPIAAANLPVWATTNQNDPNVYSGGTIGTVQLVNEAATNKTLAKATVFPVSGHDAWTHTYDPSFKENNMNVYEWMLSKTRGTPDNGGNVVLPVVLKSFDAAVSGQTVVLKWTTTAEDNNNFFTLEHSSNGTDFTHLSRVSSKNNSAGSDYSFNDTNPIDGLNYYRLSQTDKDGKTVYFEVAKVQFNGSAQSIALRVFPNPVVSQLDLTLNNTEKGQVKVSVISNDGRIVATHLFNKGVTKWNQRIDVGRLMPGYYLIKADIGATSYNTRFIKQ